MKSLFFNFSSACLMFVAIGWDATPTHAQTSSPSAPATTDAKPATLVPSGTTSSGATRLRLVANDAPAPTSTSPAVQPNGILAPLAPSPAALPPVLAPPVATPPSHAEMPRLQLPPKNGNDPTVPGPAIRELLGQGEAKTQTPQAMPGMPLVRLRARMSVRGKPTVAIVEIDRRLFSIREGEEITVPTDGAPVPVKVLRLSATELQLEFVNRRAVINLN